MRDYEFGNFLHGLRMRRGLSQYQLGMLVGVSDKAVSKWENGSARPQSRLLYKLSEVLGVSVDEILACKYRSAQYRDSKGVFAMKKKLWEKAWKAMTDLYGDVPPVEAVNRYYSEFTELENTDQIIYFEFLGRMAARARHGGGHMRIYGGLGASFAAYLMGASEINPLRAHYYCPECRKIQFEGVKECGWDLPVKKCICGRELTRDGHNLPFETLRPMFRRAAHYDISVSWDLYREAREMLSNCFQGNKIVTLVKEESGIRTCVIPDAELPDLEDGQEVPFGENYDRLKNYPGVTFIHNEELDAWGRLEEETGVSFDQAPFAAPEVFRAIVDGDTAGIFEFRSDFARAMVAESGPASIRDLIQIPGLCHGTGVWRENGQALVRAGHPIGSLIAYRDDVFCRIREKMGQDGASGTGYAYHVMEDVRRGVYARKGMPKEIRRQLLELGVEEWQADSFEKIQYLFPKAFGTLSVKYAMILMWYKLNYPEAFGRIILEEKGD